MENIPNRENKNGIWQETLNSLENVADRLGQPMDENIKEAVTGLIVNGINTSGSCGGHLDEDRLVLPYISGEAQGEPPYRYEGEKEFLDKIKEKYNLEHWRDLMGIKEAEEEYWEWNKEDHEELSEYKTWFPQNEILEDRVILLLTEFNKTRGRDEEAKIQLSPIYPGYRIEAYSKEKLKEMTQSNPEEIKSYIIQAQELFESFGQFLKNKFISG